MKPSAPIAFDASGLAKADRALLERSTGPAERVLIRLGQPPFREKVFPSARELAKQAGLPAGAKALFSFDVFELPRAGAQASSSPDIVAMVDALASHARLAQLPSAGRHPLSTLCERCRVLGGWGDAKLCG